MKEVKEGHFITGKTKDTTLPDGSKITYGIKGKKIALVYQKSDFSKPIIYVFDGEKRVLTVDGKPGAQRELEEMDRHVNYLKANLKDTVVLSEK